MNFTYLIHCTTIGSPLLQYEQIKKGKIVNRKSFVVCRGIEKIKHSTFHGTFYTLLRSHNDEQK